MATRVSLTWPNYLKKTIVVDGTRHRLTPKLAELALLLILRRGTFVSMPEIIEFLWPDPDFEPDFSEDVIRTYVSRLRKVLPERAIIARAVSCTDLMEAGHYLAGALMLVKEHEIRFGGKLARKRVRATRALRLDVGASYARTPSPSHAYA